MWYLCKRGIKALPAQYVLPLSDGPAPAAVRDIHVVNLARLRLIVPSKRIVELVAMDVSCCDLGFFHVVNHGVDRE